VKADDGNRETHPSVRKDALDQKSTIHNFNDSPMKDPQIDPNCKFKRSSTGES
jgi:hypothetical protein